MTDYELACKLFTYDESIQGLRWKCAKGPLRPPAIAGGDNGRGYFRVNFGGKLRLRSHIIWLMHTGSWPVKQLDHINRNSLDDRFVNLREVTQSENIQNQVTPRKGNKAGLRGVALDARGFRATISKDRKQIGLGTHKTAEEAHAAYLRAKEVLHEGAVL